MSEELHNMFGRARLDDRQLNELIGLARGLTAGGHIDQAQAEYLQNWLVAHRDISANPIASNLLFRINAMLADHILDEDESKDLFEILEKFTGGHFELGEVLKSTTLPLDDPAPLVVCPNNHFCFTGTFAYGSRRDCEAAVERLGGHVGGISMRTNYLVIGIYATGSWKHSSYGLKIERAMEMRVNESPIKIIGEQHWRRFISADEVALSA